MRPSRATRAPPPGGAPRSGLLQRARLLKLTGTGSGNREQFKKLTVPRNGWSGRNSLENDWSLLLLRLNAVPMSAKAARLTVSLMIGIRYSKFPRICVSPPTEVNERGKPATLLPLLPVKTPIWAADAGIPATSVIAPEGVVAIFTFRDVINVS